MFINTSKKFLVHPSSTKTWILVHLNKRNTSTISSTSKLTTSYFHHVSSLPLIYKTLGQTFDETVNKYPNHECYIFKSMLFYFLF